MVVTATSVIHSSLTIEMPNERVHANDGPGAVGPYSHAIKATAGGPIVYISGQAGLVPSTGKLVEGGVAAEATQTMENLGSILRASGLDFGDIIKTTVCTNGPLNQCHLRMSSSHR